MTNIDEEYNFITHTMTSDTVPRSYKSFWRALSRTLSSSFRDCSKDLSTYDESNNSMMRCQSIEHRGTALKYFAQ